MPVSGYEFLNLLGMLKIVRVLRLVKLARVLRFEKLIRKLDATEEIKMSLKLLKLILFLLFFLHATACVWFYIVIASKTWVPPLDYIFAGPTDFYELDTYDQYWTCVYNAVLMLNGNELGPRDLTQMIFISLVLVSSAMINGNIFGNMALIVSELSKKSASFYEKLDIANTTMKDLKLPASTQRRVINYILYTSSTLEQ